MQIVQKEDPVLREVAKPLAAAEIQTPHISALLQKMRAALAAQEDGVAIAAPQVGASVRIFIVSRRAFAAEYNSDKPKEEALPEEKFSDMVFINPEIIKLSKRSEWLDEGCLSVRWLYGKVKRSIKVSIKALDEYGRVFSMTKGGLLAQIFQHETDHLNGILFIDKAKDLEELPLEKQPGKTKHAHITHDA